MEKLKRSRQEEFTYITLFRDDIEKLYDIFEKSYKCVEFKIDRYQLNNKTEMNREEFKLSNRIKSISLCGKQNEHAYEDIRLWSSSYSVVIDLQDDSSTQGLGVMTELRDLLESRRSKIHVFEFVRGTFGMIVFYIAVALLLVYFPPDNLFKLGLLGAISLLWAPIASLSVHLGKPNFYLYKSTLHPSLWRRNRVLFEKLILPLLAAVVSSVVSVLITLHFTSPARDVASQPSSESPPKIDFQTELLRLDKAKNLIEVVDGNMIRVQHNGRREDVRLLHIQAPVNDSLFSSHLYHQASVALQYLLRKGDLRLEIPNENRDDDGKLWAFVFIDNLNVNVEMVRLGWADYAAKGKECKYANELFEAEREAMKARRGKWDLPEYR